MNIGVIVGRFQSPYLTDGHRTLLQEAYKESDEVAIFLLNNEIPFSDSNPIPYDLREKMILDYVRREFKEKKTQFYCLPDQKYASKLMFSIDQTLTAAHTNQAKFTLYGGDKSLAIQYQGIAEVKIVGTNYHSCTAKDARNEAYDLESINVNFLQGVIHALNYRRVVCHNYIVSILLYQDESGNIFCLAKNDTRLKKYIFPLTPVTSTYGSYEEQSMAEMKKLLKDGVVTDGSHIVSKRIDDWRFRHTSDFAYYHVVVHRVFKVNIGMDWVPLPFPLIASSFEEEFEELMKHINALRP